MFSTDHTPGRISTTDTTDDVFHAAGDVALEGILTVLEEATADPRELISDIDLIDGVLVVVVDGVGTWVLNKHGVTRQIWVSSPLSGPSKYNFHAQEAAWKDERAQRPLRPLLEQEFADSLGGMVKFEHQL
jgi:frataxin